MNYHVSSVAGRSTPRGGHADTRPLEKLCVRSVCQQIRRLRSPPARVDDRDWLSNRLDRMACMSQIGWSRIIFLSGEIERSSVLHMSLHGRFKLTRRGYLNLYSHKTLTIAATYLVGEEEKGWPEEKSIVVAATPEPPPTLEMSIFFLFHFEIRF